MTPADETPVLPAVKVMATFKAAEKQALADGWLPAEARLFGRSAVSAIRARASELAHMAS